jgi:hypothetical protein
MNGIELKLSLAGSASQIEPILAGLVGSALPPEQIPVLAQIFWEIRNSKYSTLALHVYPTRFQLVWGEGRFNVFKENSGCADLKDQAVILTESGHMLNELISAGWQIPTETMSGHTIFVWRQSQNESAELQTSINPAT